MRGYLLLVLHAHLPYVRHPEYDRFLEEDWLFEALTESYLPLLTMLERLAADGVPARLALSLSPTLVSMLEDGLLQERYLRHLEGLIELAGREVYRTRREPQFKPLALYYRRLFLERRRLFEERYRRRLLPGWCALQEAGELELVCGTATHAYLPLLRFEPAAVRAQVRTGAAYCAERFGRPARGMWLAECGYYPGLESVLQEAGVSYFFLETHGVELARPTPPFAPYEPVRCPGGAVAFGRDREACRLVWSAEAGYPGDPDYREFYRDVGFDLPLDYVGKYLHEGRRGYTGLKYYRVTGGAEAKEPYCPERAAARAREHAADFVFRLGRQVSYLGNKMGRPPLVVAPYDAELFGHWWFEGPLFLEALIRELHGHPDIEMVTPSVYLEREPPRHAAQPAASSWGAEGYHGVWLSGGNDWIWPQLHRAAEAMRELVASRNGQPGPVERRALNQALRSLMLAQASDWPFLMRAGTAAEYARGRLRGHLGSFFYLEQAIRSGRLDSSKIEAIEELEAALPGMVDYQSFR
jgi:1,4-alpha-glucan branching enzyme